MKECLMAILDCPYWNLVNFFLAMFAAAISVGYLLKPRLCYVGFIHNNKWKVRVINRNFLMVVKEVQCEIVVSEHHSFSITKTLPLNKDKTLALKPYGKTEDDYVYITRDNIETIQGEHRNITNAIGDERDYKFLRIRILAPNFLGVRKYYERVYQINRLPFIQQNGSKPAPLFWRKHKRCQRKMFKNLECNGNT
ncbi:MAG: hypothetical protein GX437_12465 [Sphingobacteriales bacterium]|nr:hypothetical protein [Sphingobacteriales bacterium]